MTIKPGDRGHVEKHNAIDAALAAVTLDALIARETAVKSEARAQTPTDIATPGSATRVALDAVVEAAVTAGVATTAETVATHTTTLAGHETEINALVNAPMWVAAQVMQGSSGSPALGNVGTYWRAWLLDAAASEVVAATVDIPSWVATVHVDVHWTNAGAGTGDVRMRVASVLGTSGETLLATYNNVEQTVTAPAQNVLSVTRFSSLPVAALATLMVARIGANAADTLANDIGVIGVRVVVASTAPFA